MGGDGLRGLGISRTFLRAELNSSFCVQPHSLTAEPHFVSAVMRLWNLNFQDAETSKPNIRAPCNTVWWYIHMYVHSTYPLILGRVKSLS